MSSRSLACLLCVTAVLALPVRGHAEFPTELGNVEGRVVLVDFWASWCVPCRRSFPWMNQMLRKYRDQGLQIIGVNLDKDRNLARDFLAETPANFGVRYDPKGELAERYGVQAMPSSFLLDANGKVISTHLGFRSADADDYEATIVKALADVGSSP